MKKVLIVLSLGLIVLGMWLVATSGDEEPAVPVVNTGQQIKTTTPPNSQLGMGMALIAGGVLSLVMFWKR